MRLSPRLATATAAAAVIGLTACAPMGYTAAPTMTAYVNSLLPAEKRTGVSEVALCYQERMEPHAGWYATVQADNGNIYHYKLHIWRLVGPDEKAPSLARSSTSAQRKAMRADDRPWELGCFAQKPDYLLHMKGSVAAFVDSKVLVERPFDDEAKLPLQRAVEVIGRTSDALKKFKFVEETWGVKP